MSPFVLQALQSCVAGAVALARGQCDQTLFTYTMEQGDVAFIQPRCTRRSSITIPLQQAQLDSGIDIIHAQSTRDGDQVDDRYRRHSASLERRLALFEEGAGAFAHVVGGKHQAKLRGLVFQAFLDAAFAADVHAVEHAA